MSDRSTILARAMNLWMPSAVRHFDKKKARGKSKVTAEKVFHQFHNSIEYERAVALLADQMYTYKRVAKAVDDLNYDFFNEAGESKGSGRDYLVVLKSFCDGELKTSLSSRNSLDTRTWISLSTSMRQKDAFFRAMKAFERGNNSGKRRITNAWCILSYVQLAALVELAAEESK